ncbi:MAG: sulfotransferase [Caldilineales bacterium]|nr:sulfotransferase [Caldilineales bacterium]
MSDPTKNWGRKAVADARRLGEHAKFAVKGRPDPSAAIVLASSGRSGSTWLADILSALPGVQQIFEPFHPEASAVYRRLSGWDGDQGPVYLRAYLRPDEPQPEWHALLADVLSGRVRNYRSDYARTSYFPDRFLVKFIRANLMLGFIYENFRPAIIFLVRHPCAVVYSRLHRVRTPWHADVKHLLRQEKLVEDYLRPWLTQIEAETDLLGAHALWWAVESRVAMDDLSTRPHQFIYYEALVREPKVELNRILPALGYTDAQIPAKVLTQTSRVTTGGQTPTIAAWQRDFTPAEQSRILTWAERFDIPWYDDQPLPSAIRNQENDA